MKHGGSIRNAQGLSNHKPNQSNPRTDTYFFYIYLNIVLASSLDLPRGLFPIG